MSLTPDQQGRLDRARAVLAEPHGYDAGDLAAHIGRLDYWLRDVLSLVGQLTEAPPANGGPRGLPAG